MTITDSDLTRHALRTAVAQVCLSIGWTSIHNAPLNIMVDVLHRFISQIGRTSQNRAELYGRTDSNVLDLALTFDDLGVNLPDLEEYIQHFEVAPAKEIPEYPAPSTDDLNILKPGSREVLHRPLHVHDHLPAMYPEMEETPSSPQEEIKGEKEGEATITGSSTPYSKGRGFPRDTANDIPKQPDDGCPLREVSSVMMTSSGFLSPCREGKLPESRTIHIPQDPEEKKVVRKVFDDKVPRKPAEAASSRPKNQDPPIQIKQEIDQPVQIKQEIIDDDEEFNEEIEIHKAQQQQTSFQMQEEKRREELKKQIKVEPQRDLKPKYTTSENIDLIMEAVIQRGIRESEKYPEPEYSDGDWDMEADTPPKAPPPKKPKGRPPKATKRAASPGMSDILSAPQHFTANTKTPQKKMARIPKITETPKITEKVTLPSPSSLMGGLGLPAFPGMGGGMPPGMNPMQNPLFPMNLYGFGGIPANLIPGFNPNLLNTMALMQHAQAAAAANAATGGGDDAVTLDDELEEGEISPPDTPTLEKYAPLNTQKRS